MYTVGKPALALIQMNLHGSARVTYKRLQLAPQELTGEITSISSQQSNKCVCDRWHTAAPDLRSVRMGRK